MWWILVLIALLLFGVGAAIGAYALIIWVCIILGIVGCAIMAIGHFRDREIWEGLCDTAFTVALIWFFFKFFI